MDTVIETAELQEAARLARRCEATFRTLQRQLNEQRKLVSDISNKLLDEILARRWKEAGSVEEAAKARLKCSDLANRLHEEQELLAAIEATARNSEADVLSAGNRVQGIISELVTNQIGEMYVDAESGQLTAA